jgi:SAM-dependent methyltransferase
MLGPEKGSPCLQERGEALIEWLDRQLYPDQERGWDNQRFAGYVRARLAPAHVVLDFGAGRGIHPALDFRGEVAKVVGVDPDPAVLSNDFLDEAKVMHASGEIPYPGASFDLAFCNNVLEHLEDPVRSLLEVRRVLKPGGWFLAKAPNRLHYVALAARVTPQWFHEWINHLRGTSAEDLFPTVYRCNTPERVRRVASTANLRIVDVQLWEGRPEYLRISVPTYLLGAIYERLVNATPRLARLRAVLAVTLQKPLARS